MEKIGGEGKVIQMDKMAFRKGQLISNPTEKLDHDRTTIWIIGGIEEKEEGESNPGKFFIEIKTGINNIIL